VPPSERVIRRLRAHRLVPEHALVMLVTRGARLPDGTPVAWLAVHPVTGASYRVASASGSVQVASARQWVTSARDGVTMVEPARGESAGDGMDGSNQPEDYGRAARAC